MNEATSRRRNVTHLTSAGSRRGQQRGRPPQRLVRVLWPALGIGRPNPNDKVAKDLIISRATAARRIRQAKDKGYLPEDLATIVHDELANKDRRNKR